MDSLFWDICFALLGPLLLWFVLLPIALLFAAYLIFILAETIREWRNNSRRK